MIHEQLIGFYQERADRFAAESLRLKARYDQLSMARLVVFLFGAGFSAFLFAQHWVAGLAASLAFLAGFYRLVTWHRQVLDQADQAERLAQINLSEVHTLEHRFPSQETGAAFLEPSHPNALDLDLFGPHSLFHYCNRASTNIGRQQLADFLSHPASAAEINARQVAISELRQLLDWRQNLQVLGLGTNDQPQHLALLRAWLKDPNVVLGNQLPTIAIFVAPWYFLVAFLAFVFYLPWPVFLLSLGPIFLLLKKNNEQVGKVHLRTTYAGAILEDYHRLIAQIESAPFTAPLLLELQAQLATAGEPASKRVKRLSYIIRQLNVRYNFFAIFLNIMGLWDLQWVYRLEKWRAQLEAGKLEKWFDTLKTVEALSSLANLWALNPDWTLPVLHTAPRLMAQALGHPLIHQSKRVANDFEMPIHGHIKLVTGSNMAGKSTFLRTVGLNIVLAQAGSAVCARRLELPRLQVFTSMRTQDALHESTSSFYAELKRLKTIIEAVGHAQQPTQETLPVLFLLDEILKGTNSVDRHTGAAALIRQLIRMQGGGIIATHDLELGRLEAESNGTIENRCMEVEIRDKALFFDYKLKNGVSKSFNATLLMQQMGIEIS